MSDIHIMKCKICGDASKSLSKEQVLGKHFTNLYECQSCNFIFMDPIYWLDEAYQRPITALDLGYVERNLRSADFVEQLLAPLPPSLLFVDYGGGTGMFVRMMRDRGFRFHIVEPYTETTFANNCEANVDRFGRYGALTAIEVFEHLPNPIASFKEMLTFSSAILFTTELYPNSRPAFGTWWYSGLEHGQHVSFHSEKSLEALGRQFGLKYKRLSSNWHLIAPADHALMNSPTKWGVSKWRRRVTKLSHKVKFLFSKPKRRPSLLQEDYRLMRQAFRSGTPEHTHLDHIWEKG
ncbi:class I SAM-dependent methyltransferase [Rhizobium rhizogenes]|nr:class I SAM-dependent methyltransferase [Rhizobium rhizogenes]